MCWFYSTMPWQSSFVFVERRLVEAAGIEPASWTSIHAVSTCIVGILVFNPLAACRQATARRVYLLFHFIADRQNSKAKPVSRRLFIIDRQQWWETRCYKLSSECEVVVRICCFVWLITRPSDFRDTQRHGLDSSRTRGAPISKNYLIISVLAIKSKVSISY